MLHLHAAEHTLMMPELFTVSVSGMLHKVFCAATMAIVILATQIRWQRHHRVVGSVEAEADGCHAGHSYSLSDTE